MKTPIVRGLSVVAQLAGAWAAISAACELLDAASLGTLLSGSGRWLYFGVAVGGAALALAGAGHDLFSRDAVPRRVVRQIFVIAVLVVVAQMALSTHFRVIVLELCAGLGAAALACLRWLDHRLVPVMRYRPARWVDLLVFQLCLIAVLLEFGLRVVSVLVPSPVFAPANERVEQIMARARYAPGTLRFGFPCNSGGHYDTEFEPVPDGRRLIVSIGDSFGAGVVPHHYHFTTVCERALGDTEVFSLGIPELGPGGYLHLLRDEGLRLNPDLIVVNLFVGNDLWDALRWNNPRGHPLGRWLDRSNMLLLQVPGRLLLLASESWRMAGEATTTAETRRLDTLEEVARTYPWVADPMLESPSYSEAEYIRFVRKYYRHTYTSRIHGAYEKTVEALAEMRRLAGDIPILVMIIPDEYQVDDEVWRELREDSTLPDLGRYEVQERLVPMLGREGFPVLDLLPVLRAELPLKDGRPHLYMLRDGHLNVRGNQVAGAALAAFVREGGW